MRVKRENRKAASQALCSGPGTKLCINIMTISTVITACLYDLAVGLATHAVCVCVCVCAHAHLPLMLRMELKALCMLGKSSTTLSHIPSLNPCICMFQAHIIGLMF